MNRKILKEKEINFLLEEYQKNPALFERKCFIDDSNFLEKIGIFFPPYLKDNFSPGYLKFYPQDFIVEEILKDGRVIAVDSEELRELGGKINNKDKDNSTLYSILVKCGVSTIEAIEDIARFLKTEQKNIRFAGIKDKNALTAQLISFRGISKEKLKEVSFPYFFLKGTYSGKGAMETGSLKGNNFIILVRTNNSFKKENFYNNLKIVQEQGFFNFFYSQRFAPPRFANWYWGLLILKGRYREAIFSFLSFSGERESLYFKKIREEIKKDLGDWNKIEKTINFFPLIFENELKVVSYLKKNPQDYIGALQEIPEQVKLWVFAYASLLFNKNLSFYLKEKRKMPLNLPLILSKDKNDWLAYYDFLKEDGILSMPLKNLRPFNFIQWKKRRIKTREMPEIKDVKIIPEGVVFNFILPKGCYATTFLSHFFELCWGLPLDGISDKEIDIKEILGKGSVKELLKRFKEVIYPSGKGIFG